MSAAIKVVVSGAAGRMGATVCEAVEAAAGMDVAGRADPQLGTSLEEALPSGEVMVDFSTPETVVENVNQAVNAGVHAVVGATGFDLDQLRFDVESADGDAKCFVAPNFAIGAVLMMHLAKQAARHMGSAEIIEAHHTGKLDAPSGTARKTAQDIAEVWRTHGRPPGGEAHPDEQETVPGARGADVDGVHVHGVRVLGRLAHQEVVFGGPGENLTIRHDTMERTSFMPGVLLAIKEVGSRRGLTVGLEHLLGLT